MRCSEDTVSLPNPSFLSWLSCGIIIHSMIPRLSPHPKENVICQPLSSNPSLLVTVRYSVLSPPALRTVAVDSWAPAAIRQGHCRKQLSELGLHFPAPLIWSWGPATGSGHWTRSGSDACRSQDAVLKEAPHEPPCFLSSFTWQEVAATMKDGVPESWVKGSSEGDFRNRQPEKSRVPESLLCDPEEPSHHWITRGQE